MGYSVSIDAVKGYIYRGIRDRCTIPKSRGV